MQVVTENIALAHMAGFSVWVRIKLVGMKLPKVVTEESEKLIIKRTQIIWFR